MPTKTHKKTTSDPVERPDTATDDGSITLDLQPFLMPLSIILAGGLIALGLYFGLKGNDTASANNGGSKTTANDTTTDTGATAETAEPETNEASTTIDDDPVLGDKSKAKVAIVEFSDYECPFCKRHFQQTYDQIKENYIDTGKAILVFRDMPLYFHDPLATQQAQAAECVQDLAGDAKYFEYHDKIFSTTSSNGTGMQKSQLYDFAEQVGVSRSAFTDCFDSSKFAAEVQADITAGQQAGITGTPGFIIGKLGDDGSVDGEAIYGAYPYATFQETIEKYL